MKGRLIYAEIAPEKQIDVARTLNSPGCPLEEISIEDAEKTLQNNNPDCEVNINLVCDPACSLEELTEGGKEQLGF